MTTKTVPVEPTEEMILAGNERDAEIICPVCRGNDRSMPCAYPSERMEGCLRDKRLANETAANRDAEWTMDYGGGPAPDLVPSAALLSDSAGGLSADMLDRLLVELTHPDELGMTDPRIPQAIALAKRALSAPNAAEPFCWYRHTRDITDEWVTVYSDDNIRPHGDDWKPLYEPSVTNAAEPVARFVQSQDLRELLTNIQNRISSPADAIMANGLLRKLDALPAAKKGA